MKELYAPCGIDCSTCPVLIATQNNDSEARKTLAERFKTEFGKDVEPETIVCDWCLSDGRLLNFCAVCEIRACAFGKGYATCAECGDFPCDKGQFIWKKNSASLENLNKLKG